MNRFISWRWIKTLLLSAVLIYVLAQRAPTLIRQFRLQGSFAPAVTLVATEGRKLELRNPGHPVLLVFWASWCKPCEIEIGRIVSEVEAKKIPSEFVWLIGVFDQESNLLAQHSQRQLPFPLVTRGAEPLISHLEVNGTPTLATIDENGRIVWLSTGLSPFLSFHLKRLHPKGRSFPTLKK